MATRQEESTMAEILVEKLGVPAFYLANKVIIINVFDNYFVIIIMIIMAKLMISGGDVFVRGRTNDWSCSR